MKDTFGSLPFTISLNAIGMAVKVFVLYLVLVFLIGYYLTYFGSTDNYRGQGPFWLLLGLSIYAVYFAPIPITLAVAGDILLSLMVYRYFWDNKSSATMLGAVIGSAMGFFSVVIAVSFLIISNPSPINIWHVMGALIFTSTGMFVGGLEGLIICHQGIKKGFRI